MISDLSVSLQKYFGFPVFRPGQVDAIQSLLEKRNTLVIMPTGSGKSLVFQLTAMLLPGLTIVISPLVALMKDQVDQLISRGIAATFINSSLDPMEQSARIRNLSLGKYRIVYIAPERLRSAQFLAALKGQTISLLAVDEAHCISEWGHDFRPDYLQIAKFRVSLGNPLTAALTATATPKVQDEIIRLLKMTAANKVVTGFNRPNLALKVLYLSTSKNRFKALQQLLSNLDQGSAILYTGTRRDSEEVAEFISTVLHQPAVAYHAGLPAEDRTRIQNLFMSGKIRFVAATNAFGMGIDRADVRLVIHTSIPGSLEAYYQEAGRAGRDGLPANAILFYSPKDRALQEFFIIQGALTVIILRQVYDALPGDGIRNKFFTIDDLSAKTSLHPVAVRLALAALETAGAFEHQEDSGMRILGSRKSWNEQQIQASLIRNEQHQRHRTTQLDKMIQYAESNQCRRRIILNHFGDTGPATAAICCDNCQAKPRTEAVPQSKAPRTTLKQNVSASIPPIPITPTTQEAGDIPQPARAALIVLDSLRRLRRNLGRDKIIKILRGSQAAAIHKYGYDQFVYYGRLAVLSQDELEAIIEQLQQLGFTKVIGGEYPVLHLTPAGEKALQEKAILPIKLDHQYSPHQIELKKATLQAGGTLELTAQMLSQGLNVAEIANQRLLTLSTIYTHCAKLIGEERLNIEQVIPDNIRMLIEDAIQKVGSLEYLSPILNFLPSEINPGMVRCVVESWKKNPPPSKPLKPSSPPAHELDSSIDEFLNHPHPRLLHGPWKSGWALDSHSRYEGAEWQRTPTGDLVHRLKYENDLSALPMLTQQAIALIAAHPDLGLVDAIVPVPPSIFHPSNPVILFAQALASQMGLEYLPCVTKARQTAQQKEMHTLTQKKTNLAGAFKLQSVIRGKRLLVVDDLFDSGITLQEMTKLLIGADANCVCVLTLTRTIHSDD